MIAKSPNRGPFPILNGKAVKFGISTSRSSEKEIENVETPELIIRNMRREELDVLVDWAAREGWNPGLADAEVFWATDPDGFIAAEHSGEMVGGGSIVSYGGRFGFMGFFIMRPDLRGRGLGDRLWRERLRRLIERLDAPAVIGMDGVFDMQAYYARGGFSFAGRDLRFEGIAGAHARADGIVALDGLPFDVIDAYDRAHFPAPRSDFLRRWISSPGSLGLAKMRDDRLCGYGLVRPCRTGYKTGPLFADDAAAADDLLRSLSNEVEGEALFLDVPENNRAAVDLARAHGMEEVFGCARMYYGPRPSLPEQEIFGVTTFELG
jgi:ribosomal protein S18 acetylase RimI-like enzyme